MYYNSATGLELSKIYADDSSELRTYDAFNRLATITDARGVMKTHTYDVARGLLLSESYSGETNNRTHLYNSLAMPAQINDDAGVENFVYNSFNEHEIREGCKPNYKSYPCLWLITWDPTQPVATRPLAIQKDGTWYTYGWDLTKNICEVFGQNGYIRSTYAYTPFGSATTSGDITQPIQWSSEYYDNELALVYYNYRHYNPTDGRRINRDPIAEQGGWNLYGVVGNRIFNIDNLGMSYKATEQFVGHNYIITQDPKNIEIIAEFAGNTKKTRAYQNIIEEVLDEMFPETTATLIKYTGKGFGVFLMGFNSAGPYVMDIQLHISIVIECACYSKSWIFDYWESCETEYEYCITINRNNTKGSEASLSLNPQNKRDKMLITRKANEYLVKSTKDAFIKCKKHCNK